jgi:hypothetical protein
MEKPSPDTLVTLYSCLCSEHIAEHKLGCSDSHSWTSCYAYDFYGRQLKVLDNGNQVVAENGILGYKRGFIVGFPWCTLRAWVSPDPIEPAGVEPISVYLGSIMNR